MHTCMYCLPRSRFAYLRKKFKMAPMTFSAGMDITLLSLSDYLFFSTTVMMLHFSVLGDALKTASAKDLWGSAVRIEASVRCVHLILLFANPRILLSPLP